ncbi:hypothetical protein WJX72_002715 [[Myrmecia] bisecta]|uniref:Single-stranded DNA-binding protein n=1 Tax=[Myrmecia] bisecta TaxID=41462 RepID=A0AAW1QPS7_9CHLO
MYQQQPAYTAQQAHVPPPEIIAWSPALVNNVKLIGIVGRPPVVKNFPDGRVKVELRLGVRNPSQNRPASSWINVDFWDLPAQQAAQYVQKGTRIALTGRIKEDAWVDRATGATREMLKVVGKTFSIVDDVRAGTTAADGPVLPRAPRPMRAPRDKYAPSAIALASYNMYHNEGRSIAETAAATARRLGTVTEHIVTSVMAGMPIEVARLAAELQMGPAGSEFISADDVDTAIEAHLADVAREAGPPADLYDLRLKPIRQQLDGSPQTVAKLQRQLDRGNGYLDYAQIKFVLAMKKYGYDWGTLITADPPAQYLVGPAAAVGGAGLPSSGPWPQQDRAEDDIPPF